MSAPLILGAFWVVASAIVALLPMKRQMLPGVLLMAAAPVLLIWIGMAHGWLWGAFGIFAFLSMFRNPLIYFGRKLLGLPVQDPTKGEA